MAGSSEERWRRPTSRFRADLLYRLNVVEVQVPPLRDLAFQGRLAERTWEQGFFK